MSESEATTSWWSICSNVMAVVSVGAAVVVLELLFPAAGTESSEGNEHVAIAIEAVVAFVLAAYAVLVPALLGACAAVIGLFRRERWSVPGLLINAFLLATAVLVLRCT